MKWINDKIDNFNLPSLDIPGFQEIIINAQRQIKDNLRTCEETFLLNFVQYSNSGFKPEYKDKIDEWNNVMTDIFHLVIKVLTLINCKYPVIFLGASTHGYINKEGTITDIIIVSGSSHKNNYEHIKKYYQGSNQRKAIIISRDQDDLPILEIDRDITDTNTNIKRCGYHELCDCFRGISNSEDFITRMKALIN